MSVKKYQAVLAGEKYENGKWIDVLNPVDQTIIGQVPALETNDLTMAYNEAVQAQKSWHHLGLYNRIKYLTSWKELIIRDQKKIAELISLEVAKTYKEALKEVMRSVEYIEYTLEEAKRIHPKAYDGDGWNLDYKIGIFDYVPKGVVLAISPFNYPINLAISKIFPALVMGNSVVFKPATQGALTGLYLSQLSLEANLPAGIFNAVSGLGREIGDSLVSNAAINVISFTGSSAVGCRITKIAKMVDLVLELGGKDPALVLSDADFENAAAKIIKGAFSFSGQRCTAIKLVLVAEEKAELLIDLLVQKIKNLTVGYPVEDVDIGPVIDIKTVQAAKQMIDDAVAAGAEVLLGHQYQENLMWPTLVDKVTPEMTLAREEPFAPVLPIIRFKTEQEAIDIINRSRYGLQASIFTSTIDHAISIADLIETGTVNINDQSQRGPDHFPFVGIKDSGLGIQGIRDSLHAFSRPKGLIINWKSHFEANKGK